MLLMPKPASRAVVAVLGVVALTLTSCGGSDKAAQPKPEASQAAEEAFAEQDANAIKDAVVTDMQSLTSMTMSGAITSRGDQLEVDLVITTDSTCSGTMGIGGGVAQILAVDGTSYLKGDQAFWTATGGPQGAAVLETIGDKWAQLPSGSSFESFCDLDALLDQFDEEKPGTTVTKGEVGELAGEPTVQLITEEKGGTTTTWVTTGEQHYIIQIERVGGDQPGTITLSEFNEPLDVTAPTAEEIFDLSGGS
jgi:hypothetical protein